MRKSVDRGSSGRNQNQLYTDLNIWCHFTCTGVTVHNTVNSFTVGIGPILQLNHITLKSYETFM